MAVCVYQKGRALHPNFSSTDQRHSTRSGIWLDQNPRPSAARKTELQRILEDQKPEMTEKENILARIREALAVPAPMVGSDPAPGISPPHSTLYTRPSSLA